MQARPQDNRKTERHHNRRGAIVIVAMICLLLATMILGTLLKLSITQRRQAERAQLRLQADWLAEAALERAAAMLQADQDYTGETWNRTAEEMAGNAAGRVVIEVENVESNENRRHVTVTADYPPKTDHRARVQKAIVVDLKPAD